MMAKYFIELCCISYPMSHYRPSEVNANVQKLFIYVITNSRVHQVAAAALLLSLRVLEGADVPVWTNTLHFYTTYSETYLRPIMLKLAEVVQEAPTSKIKSVYTKYRMPKFSQVAVRSELNEKNMQELKIQILAQNETAVPLWSTTTRS